jgi:hypothetical protein
MLTSKMAARVRAYGLPQDIGRIIFGYERPREQDVLMYLIVVMNDGLYLYPRRRANDTRVLDERELNEWPGPEDVGLTIAFDTTTMEWFEWQFMVLGYYSLSAKMLMDFMNGGSLLEDSDNDDEDERTSRKVAFDPARADLRAQYDSAYATMLTNGW